MVYRKDIDGLRAIAVIAVIVNHFNSLILPGGYLGVDCFFVISGFVITSSLLMKKFNSNLDFLRDFYSKRVKRIFPSLIVYVSLMSIFLCFVNNYPGKEIKTAISSIFGISNIYIYLSSIDYFGFQSQLNPFVNTWSLGVEEQFYIFFPLFFILLNINNNKNNLKKLFYLITILSLFSIIGFQAFYKNNFSAVYYLMPFRFWEIGAGCLCSIYCYKAKKSLKCIKYFVSFSNLLLIGSFFIPNEYGAFSTLLVIICTCIILLDDNQNRSSKALFTNKLSLFVGKRSYSLYLWHWGILTIGKLTISNNISLLFQIFLLATISILNYQLVEKNFRYKEWKLYKFGIKTISGLLIIISSLFLYILGKHYNHFLYLGEIYENNKFSLEDNRIIVYGDSISKDIANIIKNSSNVEVIDYSKNGCKFYKNKDGNDKYCSKHYQKINKIIDNFSSNDILILASDIINYLEIDDKGSIKNTVHLSNLKTFLDENIRYLNSKNIKVLYLLPYPYQSYYEDNIPGQLCRREFFRPTINNKCLNQAREVNMGQFKIRSQKYNSFISNYENEFKNLKSWDLTDTLCENNKCKPFKKGNQIYHDSIHLATYNSYLNKIVFESLIRHIEKLRKF